MKRLFAILLLAFAAGAAHCAPAKAPLYLASCQPFVKGGTGNYFVAPEFSQGGYGLHFAWACQNTKTKTVHMYYYACAYSSCSAPKLITTLWRVTTGQTTLVKEWEANTTITAEPSPASLDGLLLVEARQNLSRLRARVLQQLKT